MEWFEADLCSEGEPASRSMAGSAINSDSPQSSRWPSSCDSLRSEVLNASDWHETNEASVKAGLPKVAKERRSLIGIWIWG